MEAPNAPFGPLQTFDQTLFNRCKNVVSVAIQGAQELRQTGLPPAFAVTGQQYNQLTPPLHEPVQRPAYLGPVNRPPPLFLECNAVQGLILFEALTFCAQITNCTNRAEQVTFENHISRNFPGYTARWLRTILVQRRKLLKIQQGLAVVRLITLQEMFAAGRLLTSDTSRFGADLV